MSLHSQIDSHVLQEGYLYKKGKYNKSFQRRYFVLYDDRTIDYFKDKTYSGQRNKAKGSIYLTQIKRVELVQYDNKNSKCNEKDTDELKSSLECLHGRYNNNNRVISSIQPPPDYNLINASKSADSFPMIKQQQHNTAPVRSRLHRTHSASLLFESKQKWSSMGSECCISDEDMYNSITSNGSRGSMGYEHKRVISCHFQNDILTPKDEYDAFQIICKDTKLGLSCDRKYGFALISANREWILSAESNHDLKQWITRFHKLCQGEQVYDGYLNDNKYFILYKNKVLNCYKNCNEANVEFDLDLRHILYLKYDHEVKIEIAIDRNKNKKENKNMVELVAENKLIAKEWYSKILALFRDRYCILRNVYDSAVEHINIVHNGQQLKHRHIAMYREYIVIFNNEQQFNLFKNMRFFNKTIFRDYTRKSKCILIPLNRNIKIRKASKNNGKYAFLVSNADGDRKWYFSLKHKEILYNWMQILCGDSKNNSMKNNTRKRPLSSQNNTNKQTLSTLPQKQRSASMHLNQHNNNNMNNMNNMNNDTMIESTFSNSKKANDTTVDRNSHFQFPINKIKTKKCNKINTLMLLSPILDDYPSNETCSFDPALDDVPSNDSTKLSPILSHYTSNESDVSNISLDSDI